MSKPKTKTTNTSNDALPDGVAQNHTPGEIDPQEKLKTPTDPAALLDGPSYVRAVASQVDLVAASAKLVVSSDEKIAKAELDRLRELIFGKGGPPPTDETLRIDWTGFPRPDREPPSFTQSTGGDLDHH